MASVRLNRVSKSFQKGTHTIRDLDLEVRDGEFLVLVGPSGCGKSTTLRMIAGLEDPSEGEIYIGDREVTTVAPKDRDIAMVFQNYALYPHMNVYENMAFGLKLRKFSRAEIEERVREAAQILEIEDLFKRKPKELSGGQRQRVALGRAIVRKPNVFLFDEPLSNLDAKLRVQMRTEIKKLHLRLKTTMVYVTHDQVEAMTMGDRIVVMRAGIIHQIDDPLRLYNHPADLFVAGFIGSPSMNFLPAVLRADPLRAEEGKVSILLSPDHRERLKEQLDREIILGIRPEHLHLVPPPEIPVSEIRLTHEVSELMGNETYLYLTTGRTPVVCRAPQTAKTYSMNETVTLYCDIGALHYFEKDSQRAL